MEQLNFFEKLAVLGSNILAHPVFILLLLSPVVIFALNKKITKKFVIAIYIVIILVVLFVGNTTLFALLDNVVDGFFMTIYFPNFVTLFIVVVASAVITLVTFIKKNMLKVNKVINIVGFVIVQTIFCLILLAVQVNNIDIYKENALYSNSDVLTLMQLLMGSFVLQVLAVLIFTAIEKVAEMLDNKDEMVRKYRNIEKAKKLSNGETEELIVPFNKDIKVEEYPIKPLDKSLIEEVKIIPISLVDTVGEENKNVIKVEKENVKSQEVMTPDIFKAPPVIKVSAPLENKNVVSASDKEEELISDLVIINLEKTVLAIKNIKRIYTM